VPAKDAADERARIMTAAYRLLAAGSDPLSVSDVLTAAGLSTRAFYRHFDSKDALLAAMYRMDSSRVLVELQAEADGAPTAHEALRLWTRGMLRLTDDGRRRRRVLVLASDEVRRARGHRLESQRYQRAEEAALAGILRRGLEDGSFPWARPHLDAGFVRAALQQVFSDLMAQESPRDVAGASEDLLGFVLRALGAPDGKPLPRGARCADLGR
jgi:AcrR family transcriptional regulator